VPEPNELSTLVRAWLAIALAGGVAAAVLYLIVLSTRRWLPPQRRRASVWNGPLVGALFLLLVYLPGTVPPITGRDVLARWLWKSPPDETAHRLVAGGAARVITLPLFVAAWWGLLASAGYRAAALGLSPRRAAGDAVAAYRTWLVVTPAVYAANFVVLLVYALGVGKQPEEHPILELLCLHPPTPVVGLLVVQAVMVAPVCEELFFRGAVQPWLADRPWGGAFALILAAVVGVLQRLVPEPNFRDPAQVLSILAPGAFVLALVPLCRALDGWPGLVRWLPVRDPVARGQAARAIFGTAALFANVHAAVWPSPICLFVLALGLGWLAYRTQGIVAPIVMHMLFNLVAFVELYLKS
jgi:hypothetical protein